MNKQSRLSQIFNAMKSRCYNQNNKQYKDYGGRGICLCDEWNDRKKIGIETKGYIYFKNWAIENGYEENLTIDRIDVNKDYSPENCRWVTLKEHANNKTNNHYVTYKGKTQSLKKWSEELPLLIIDNRYTNNFLEELPNKKESVSKHLNMDYDEYQDDFIERLIKKYDIEPTDYIVDIIYESLIKHL